jgi:hypothetical protein
MRSYNPTAARRHGLGCFLFARHYSGNHVCFIFLQVLRCFSSLGWPPFGDYAFSVIGCPIRKSADIMLVCSSPQLIAAYHVLHRLLEPRHPPCALNCFKKIEIVFSRLLPLQNNKSYSVLQLFFPICQRTYAKRALAGQPVCDVVGFEPLRTAFTVTSSRQV